MPTIKLSTLLATKLGSTSGILASTATATSPSFSRFNAADDIEVARIRIMSGSVPSQSEIDDAYPTWDRFTGSPSEILIDSQLRASSYFASTNGIITWDLVAVEAIKSGLASWWIWSGNQDYIPKDSTVRGAAPGAPDDKRLPCIIGDITGLTGGGSMTLVDLNIIAGQTYEIGPAEFEMPRTLTYV
jgi:hypothetical protein